PSASWSVRLDGTQRSSSISRVGQARGGFLRRGRVTRRANRLRIQERILICTSSNVVKQSRTLPAPRADETSAAFRFSPHNHESPKVQKHEKTIPLLAASCFQSFAFS